MERWNDTRAIYQIYPRSYMDTNGDGIGDLDGIIAKLDHVNGKEDSLGANAIWISPFYPSPMADFGYDISDYRGVDPIFGEVADFKRLIDEAHERSIKVMIDFVPNHTSNEHDWFIKSRESRDNEKSDWYIWKDAKPDGTPPNNWLSVFGGSAWEFDDARQQYYLHSFLDKQPDLNWDNKDVRQEMADTIDYWLEMGVDGIRADAVRWMAKDPEMRDNPMNERFVPGSDSDPYHVQIQKYSRFGPQLFNYLKELTDVVKRHDDRIIVFEDYPDDESNRIEQYDKFYHNVDEEVGAPFIFDGMFLEYDAAKFREFIAEFQTELGQHHRLFYCFGNHDQPRLASRFGEEQSRLVATLQMTLPGTPVMYYGEEIGMKNTSIAPDQVRDPFEMQAPDRGLGRDPQRTPMQWDGTENAGFTTGTPWLPVGPDYEQKNAVVEKQSDQSTFALYQSLLKMRESIPALRTGEGYRTLSLGDPSVIAYEYIIDNECVRVLANMSEESTVVACGASMEILVSTHADTIYNDESMQLQPHQAVIIVEKSTGNPAGN